MKAFVSIILLALLTGCATNSGFQSYQGLELSPAQASQLTNDAVGRIEANYPPAKTLIVLDQDKGLFGSELEAELRAKGYAVEIQQDKKAEDKASGAVVSGTTALRYEVKPYGAEYVLLVVQGADGFQINRVYKKGAGELQARTGITEIKAASNE